MLIPGWVFPALIVAGILRLAAAGFTLSHFLSAVVGLGTGTLPLLILALISKSGGGDAVADGDIVLAGTAGFMLGAGFSLVLGGLISYIVLMAALILFIFGGLRKITQKVPFGPYYAVAGIAGAIIVTILTLWR